MAHRSALPQIIVREKPLGVYYPVARVGAHFKINFASLLLLAQWLWCSAFHA